MIHEVETKKYLSSLRGFESKPSSSDFVLRYFTSKLQCIQQ